MLIEAKNSESREALRMAIGQLYDYCRFDEPPVRLAVLLSHPPVETGSPCCKAQASSDLGTWSRVPRLVQWCFRPTVISSNSEKLCFALTWFGVAALSQPRRVLGMPRISNMRAAAELATSVRFPPYRRMWHTHSPVSWWRFLRRADVSGMLAFSHTGILVPERFSYRRSASRVVLIAIMHPMAISAMFPVI